MSNIRILETLYHSYETTNPTTASEAGGAIIGKEETMPDANEQTYAKWSRGSLMYISLRARGAAVHPPAGALLRIVAQGHYSATPRVALPSRRAAARRGLLLCAGAVWRRVRSRMLGGLLMVMMTNDT